MFWAGICGGLPEGVPVGFSKYGSCYCHHLLREQPVPLKEVFPCA